MYITNEAVYCLWRHMRAFYKQSTEKKIADFGEPCSDCKQWETCKGNWLDKIGKTKPKEISISMGAERQREQEAREINERRS